MKGCSKYSQEQGFEKDGIRKTQEKKREHELALELQKEKEKQEEI